MKRINLIDTHAHYISNIMYALDKQMKLAKKQFKLASKPNAKKSLEVVKNIPINKLIIEIYYLFLTNDSN